MDPITQELLVAIRKIIRAQDLHSSALRRSVGLTLPQLMLLQAADNTPAATLGQLSEFIHLSQATTTTILDRLETDGLVVRYRSGSDRRKVFVRLTGKGVEALGSAPMPVQTDFVNYFESLKPHERTAVLSSFQHVADMMNNRNAESGT